MKTIKAIFTTEFQETPMGRRYSFNTNLDVEVGDLIESPDYKGKLLQVVNIEKGLYHHFSYKTGELSNDGLQCGFGDIKTLSPESKVVMEPVEKEEGF